uniref:Uncharacterized protein n=1 Tax=Rousettus aegyptiacus TaxID=9407 RepID=A0A7J8CHQ9_ROUAE|nr:hypothetical protein HJG63_008983 [Rousettus aegyptiacus]
MQLIRECCLPTFSRSRTIGSVPFRCTAENSTANVQGRTLYRNRNVTSRKSKELPKFPVSPFRPSPLQTPQQSLLTSCEKKKREKKSLSTTDEHTDIFNPALSNATSCFFEASSITRSLKYTMTPK